MTNLVEWFRYQLRASADGFEWAFSQIPLSFHKQLAPDPGYMGTWSPARHVWHVTEYERCLAIPAMYQWITSPMTPEENWPDDDDAWAKVQEHTAEELISEFRCVRQQQIELLEQLTTIDWSESRMTLWGPKPLSMVVTKTFQHTYEHGDTLLRMGLWWEEILEDEAKKGKMPAPSLATL